MRPRANLGANRTVARYTDGWLVPKTLQQHWKVEPRHESLEFQTLRAEPLGEFNEVSFVVFRGKNFPWTNMRHKPYQEIVVGGCSP
jgi:hypothetical protein